MRDFAVRIALPKINLISIAAMHIQCPFRVILDRARRFCLLVHVRFQMTRSANNESQRLVEIAHYGASDLDARYLPVSSPLPNWTNAFLNRGCRGRHS
jgi:hypothetical protein